MTKFGKVEYFTIALIVIVVIFDFTNRFLGSELSSQQNKQAIPNTSVTKIKHFSVQENEAFFAFLDKYSKDEEQVTSTEPSKNETKNERTVTIGEDRLILKGIIFDSERPTVVFSKSTANSSSTEIVTMHPGEILLDYEVQVISNTEVVLIAGDKKVSLYMYKNKS